FVRAGGRAPGLSRAHLAAMKRLLRESRTGASLSLPDGLTFHVLPGGSPSITRAVNHATDRVIHERQCTGCSEDDESGVHLAAGRLEVGTRRPGLRVRPAGALGTR